MEYKIINSFKGEINEYILTDEQSYEYLKEFIERIEDTFNLNVLNKGVTKVLQHKLYEETEDIFNTECVEYNEAHEKAMEKLLNSVETLQDIFSKLDNKIQLI